MDSHILGHGVAETQEEAQKSARADVIRQIRSQMDVEVERVAQVFQENQREYTSTSLKSTISETSSFAFAEKIVDIGKIYKKKKQYIALSCINKKETALYIQEKIETEQDRLHNLYTQLHAFFTQNDRISFTTHFSPTLDAYHELLPTILQIQSLHPNEKAQQTIQELSTIRRDADTLIAKMRIGIGPIESSVPFSAPHDINNGIAQICQQQRIRTIPMQNYMCTPDVTHVGYIHIDSSCKSIMGSQVCQLEPSFIIQDCNYQQPNGLRFSQTYNGANSRSQEAALNQAFQQIHHGDIQEALEEWMHNNAPIEKKEPH